MARLRAERCILRRKTAKLFNLCDIVAQAEFFLLASRIGRTNHET